MLHEHGLVGDRAHLHEAQAGPRQRLVDRGGIVGIVFLARDERLHTGRRDQLHIMARRDQLAAPVMRRTAGFHADKARRLRSEKRQDIAPV